MELTVWRPSHSEGRSLDRTEQSQTPELSVTLTSTPPPPCWEEGMGDKDTVLIHQLAAPPHFLEDFLHQ